MTQAEIAFKVRDLIAEELGLRTEMVQPQSDLKDDLEADSLDYVDFAMILEEQFNLSIDDEAMEKVKTVQDAVDMLTLKLGVTS